VVGAPTPVAPLVAGTKNHGLTIEMGGQSIPLSATTVVAEQARPSHRRSH
jgi:hypothetical protein